MTTGFTLDWNAIRPLNGSRADGFEELCAQLARAERPAGSRFERKGTPDAGVECYAVLADGTEWAWQAKYFDSLSESQWGQLEKSVKTALDKHPRLRRYLVCVPLDRPDARQPDRQSAKDKWDARVAKWAGWAADRGMTVEFEYVGSSELLERLAQPQHAGRVRFWFDVRAFDVPWFAARLDEAVHAAGPRYTPEVHVGLPIAEEFDAFGRTPAFFDRLKATARGIRDARHVVAFSPQQAEAAVGATTATPIDESLTKVLAHVDRALSAIADIRPAPSGELPLRRLAGDLATSRDMVGALRRALWAQTTRAPQREQTQEADGVPPARRPEYAGEAKRLRDFQYHLDKLWTALGVAHDAFAHGADVASRGLLLLTGDAGRGKTHLVCDVARQRLAAGRPTVVLMGQRFVSTADPWTQVLDHLDLGGVSVEAFVGALEAAAQAADCRALVIVDALNEGAGRLIWPNHLAAFLAHLERSPWVSVVLTVRTSYEAAVVPEAVHAKAWRLVHQGFAGHEYDATRTYFVHYGLDLPSTPLLAPEFRNPLFLKTLCLGLQATGERRLPRGFHGITAVFDLYFAATNVRLAAGLGYNPKQNLVRAALDAIARELVSSGARSLPLARAEEVVNAHLPGREFERSLYRGLVSEGLLVEESVEQPGVGHKEVVIVGYERFSDHLVAKALLDTHVNPASPEASFAEGGPVAALWASDAYVAAGVLEALCIQVPERTGRELLPLAPGLQGQWEVGRAFRQSIVWRAATAFSKETLATLNAVEASDGRRGDTFDALLTVATLPEHPYNAAFLDRQLRRRAMPDRDAWWSTYLHAAWGECGAVDRLVDWAAAVASDHPPADDVADLCATALAWMFTTANRFLRDRATTALAALLTASPAAAARLIDRFASVDDLYVRERVYAAAYGVAMRSSDPAVVGALAERVYAHVFAPESGPPAHILLRDYARGVLERALWLGTPLEAAPERFRPPYRSVWPSIPSEEEVKALEIERVAKQDQQPEQDADSEPDVISYDGGSPDWSRQRIRFSVMHDDFARYVIGTNSSLEPWLSLARTDAPWQSPAERLAAVVSQLLPEERAAWDAFVAADQAVARVTPLWVRVARRDPGVAEAGSEVVPADAPADGVRDVAWVDRANGTDQADEQPAGDEDHSSPELQAARCEWDRAAAALDAVLTDAHAERLTALVREGALGYGRGEPPRLDLGLLQRYVLWRVFDLGWTTKRFGRFDRFAIGYHGREARKAERIGKKYQWIAYHEILAYVTDHFQFYSQVWGDSAERSYDGPWQEHLRDIDPSTTLRRLPEKDDAGNRVPVWWVPHVYDGWQDPPDAHAWAARTDDLPPVTALLAPTDPGGSAWCSLAGAHAWRQPVPSDRSTSELPKREVWYLPTAYLVRAEDRDAFMRWAEGADFWGRWMPDVPEVYRLFLGEYGWAPASRYFGAPPVDGTRRWVRPGKECPVDVRVAAFEYLRESSTFDCAVDDSFRLYLPPDDLVTDLGLRWRGPCADFVDAAGDVVVFDPAAHEPGPGALLVRRSTLQAFLKREGLALCWAMLGEKRVLGPDVDGRGGFSLRMDGVYTLDGDDIRGSTKHTLWNEDERTRVPILG